jgi:tetratricopeptide (TPR) repeat protein
VNEQMIFSKNLVFIVGIPRSGTTWLLSILEKHPDCFIMTPANLNIDVEQVTKETGLFLRNYSDDEIIAKVNRLPQDKILVEKTPGHIFQMHNIKRIFPNAKIILIERNKYDILFSMVQKNSFWKNSPKSLDEAINLYIKYQKTIEKYTDFDYVLSYERLWDFTLSELTKLMNFLNLSTIPIKQIIEETRLGKSLPEGLKEVFRKGEPGQGLTEFSKNDLSLIDERISNNISKKNYLQSSADPRSRKFRILLTNHQLIHNSGSEIFTLNIANYLKQNNCEVIVYSKYLGELKDNFKKLGIKVVDNLEKIKNIKFDIAHVHHNINAIEIRYFFPDLPIIFLSQGVIPFLEQPPMFDINISHFFAISEEIKVNLVSKGIDEKQITTIGNIIDPNTFFPVGKINNTPRRALIISAKISDEKANIIKAACDALKIGYTFIGGRFGEVSQNEVNQLIQQADIVFSLGRGIIESMFCERIPIVFDYAGGDGMVTPKNFDEIRKNNFSGRRFAKNFTVEELIEEIKKYNPDDAPLLREKASELYSAPNVVKQLLSAYKSAIESFEPYHNPEIEKQLGNFYSALQETRDYTKKTAIINFKKKLNIPPVDFNKLLNISEKLIEEGQLLEASEILQMLNKTGFNEDVLINLAVIEIMIQNYSDAYTLLNKVLQVNPRNKVALENLLYIKQNSETYNNLHA